jgi:hypothetical protein
MSYHQRPHELRLAISSEAEALIANFGGEAYAEARRRAKEASSDFLARDWSEVALIVTRKTGKHLSLLARMLEAPPSSSSAQPMTSICPPSAL